MNLRRGRTADVPGPRIMPMGDSITQNAAGFRLILAPTIGTRGATWVGRTKDAANLPHEGHSGYTTTQLASIVGAAIAACQPDVVVVLAGVNDLGNGSLSVSDATAAWLTLMDTIAVAAPTCRMVACTVTPINYDGRNGNDTGDVSNATVIALNALIRANVASMRSEGYRVVLADTYAAVASVVDWQTVCVEAGDVHLKAAGYAAMAPVIWNAVEPYL